LTYPYKIHCTEKKTSYTLYNGDFEDAKYLFNQCFFFYNQNFENHLIIILVLLKFGNEFQRKSFSNLIKNNGTNKYVLDTLHIYT